jgi:hypothetical protein
LQQVIDKKKKSSKELFVIVEVQLLMIISYGCKTFQHRIGKDSQVKLKEIGISSRKNYRTNEKEKQTS